jgi:solute carrier family 25 folate transporter 32
MHRFLFASAGLSLTSHAVTTSTLSSSSLLIHYIMTAHSLVRMLTAGPQNNAQRHLYPTISACVTRTFAEEGARGFYRGLGTNLVRVLPGTCVTFVAYENIAWMLKRAAAKREYERSGL